MSKDQFILWGGVHSSSDGSGADFAAISDVTARIPAEQNIVYFDILTNIAHAAVLKDADILNDSEYDSITGELNVLLAKHEAGEFQFDPAFEDIHSQIEHVLIEKLGDTGMKIHTGRSRNDQVVTDMYLYARSASGQIMSGLDSLIDILNVQAEQYRDVLCPGYTHYQKATISSYGEILRAFSVMFQRDKQRIGQLSELYDYSPLGAGNGYESIFSLNPVIAAQKLGYAKPYESSIDVIYGRGEYESALSQCLSHVMTHLSMLAQTYIVFSMPQFNYISIGDSYTTGSSIMPQKKNPDVNEIVRGRASQVEAISSSLMSLRRAGFLGYNRDTQISKQQLVEAVTLSISALEIMTAQQESITPDVAVMRAACSDDFVTSTGFMEMLISEKKIPMRLAKKVTEKAVAYSMETQRDDIGLDELHRALHDFELEITVSEEERSTWQQPEFQYQKVQGRRRP